MRLCNFLLVCSKTDCENCCPVVQTGDDILRTHVMRAHDTCLHASVYKQTQKARLFFKRKTRLVFTTRHGHSTCITQHCLDETLLVAIAQKMKFAPEKMHTSKLAKTITTHIPTMCKLQPGHR